ncbi:peptidase domain-containing ABC transporter [Massilia sp. CT11-108]|uniref:peptidase domain-containing ABC transporter n=1 Tax=Massilia sp. CT11-108 TaxID=3393900 RepID=UPI0039A56526
MKFIAQTEASECGLACLAMIANHYGHRTDLASLRRRFSVSLKGMTLEQMLRHASALGMASRPVRLEMEDLVKLDCPCILHWNLDHFVVLKRARRTLRSDLELVILDPAVGERVIKHNAISRSFTGVALELRPTATFEKRDAPKRVPVQNMVGKIVGLRRALVQVLVMAIGLELLTLITPLFTQFILDDVVVGGDFELLHALAIGFGLVLFTQAALQLARSWSLTCWGIELGLQWSSRLFAHLLKLPPAFFEKRHLGDVISRFSSLSAIQRVVTSLLVESALDGLLAITALVLMLKYSAVLSAVVFACVLIYSGLRWLFYRALRDATQETLILRAKEESHFLETLRAITPLKLFGRESERMARWLNLRQDAVNQDIKTQKIDVTFRACSSAIMSIQNLLLFYLGAELIIKRELSVGMLTAFTVYAGTFITRVFGLIDAFINVRMLSVHTERLADIVLEPVEEEATVLNAVDRLEPSITLRNVRFRYADGEPWVLDGINLHIPAGQNVALVGPSGCGKSTLCKIIVGILAPNEGEVLIDNIPIRQVGLKAYRQLIGTVMQDDDLLAGSLLDNISFYDVRANYDDVARCAAMANIHEDILRMPMGYQSLVGDMGSILSGGQKQRVLLARALYKNPKILAMDEATSHLDIDNERKVNQALSGLDLTRIMIAHRPETIAAAERVIQVQNGKATERQSQATQLSAVLNESPTLTV